MSMDAQDVVTVAVVTNPLEAEMIANCLRGEGVAATAEGGEQPGITGNTEVRILVRAWDAARARQLLSAEHGRFEPANRSPKRVALAPKSARGTHVAHALSPRGRRYGKGSS
jgi:hypothetical protein